MSKYTVLIAGMLCLLSPLEALGQGGEVERTFWPRLGVGTHGSGREEHCSPPIMLTAGGSAETGSAWFLRGTADVLLSGLGTCEDAISLTEYRGEEVEIWGYTDFLFAPRLGAQVGRELPLGDEAAVAVAVGLGTLLTRSELGYMGATDGRRDQVVEHAWRLWYGASVELRREPDGARLEIEFGRHSVPRRYYSLEDGGLRREFWLSRNLIRFGVAFPWP